MVTASRSEFITAYMLGKLKLNTQDFIKICNVYIAYNWNVYFHGLERVYTGCPVDPQSKELSQRMQIFI